MLTIRKVGFALSQKWSGSLSENRACKSKWHLYLHVKSNLAFTKSLDWSWNVFINRTLNNEKNIYLKYTIPKIICYFCNKRKPSLSRLEQVHRLLFTYVVLATRHANKPVFYCVGLGFLCIDSDYFLDFMRSRFWDSVGSSSVSQRNKSATPCSIHVQSFLHVPWIGK